MKGKKTKKLDCKVCGEPVFNVGHDAEKVTCSKCVTKSMMTGVDIHGDEDIDSKEEELNKII
jgi:ribosomal protein S27AE